MTIIQEKDRQVLAQRLSVLPNTVKLVVFTTSQQPETSELISQLMQELVSVSGGKLTLEQHSLEAEPTVAQEYGVTHAPAIVVRNPVHIRVFVTYGCPYCPAAVRMAHKLAMASDLITAEGISSEDFPELANQYGVMAVPKTVINDRHSFEGALPEPAFVQQVLRGASSSGLIIVP
jgi:glutaredoxin